MACHTCPGAGAFVEVGVVPSKRGASLLSCGREIARTLRDLQERHGPVDAVCLEGFMKGFAAGRCGVVGGGLC